ncbi:MAG: PTS sugar transporter subunit IIB [Erysipelotrichaceae bacterium]|nr:PTS sugar transporter subunit IIB [Erysipelotrichaceae bacterium]
MGTITVRADEKLVHGNVLNSWYENSTFTCLIIADDTLASDSFLKNLTSVLVPYELDTTICKVEDIQRYLKKYETEDVMILCRTPTQALRVIEQGVDASTVTLADSCYVSKRMPVKDEHKFSINKLIEKGIRVVVQMMPEDNETVLKKYDM